MKVVVDTCAWSLALRRRGKTSPHETAVVSRLAELIGNQQVVLLGAVRQEILSGIRSEVQFRQLRRRLRSFPDLQIEADDHETAAAFFNTCRSRGVQGSNTGFLLCAVAHRRGLRILTTDRDFDAFSRILGVSLD